MKRRVLVLAVCAILVLALAVSSFAADQGVNTRTRTIKIGWYGPLTGVFQKIGEGMVDGMKAHIDLQNRRGGVGGYKVKLVALDNNNDPIMSKQIVKRLVRQDRVFAIVGALGSKGINPVFADMVAYGIPVVYLGGGEYHWAVPPRRNVFPVQPDYITEGRLMVKFAVQNLHARKLAFVYRHDDSSGRTALRGVNIAMRTVGRRVGAKLVLKMKRLATNVIVAKLKQVNPDATLVFDFFGGASGIITAAKRAGINTKWITTYVNSDAIIYKIAGKAWLGVYIGSWAKAVEPVVTNFHRYFRTTKYYRKAIAARWDAPSGYHTAGWIASEIFYGGLRAFYRKYRNMNNLTWANFIKSMETLRNFNNTIAKDITYYPISTARRGTARYYLARRGQLTLYFTIASLTRNKQFYLRPVTRWLK